jgi:hypothetical protein
MKIIKFLINGCPEFREKYATNPVILFTLHRESGLFADTGVRLFSSEGAGEGKPRLVVWAAISQMLSNAHCPCIEMKNLWE